jgi:hypothetical protein
MLTFGLLIHHSRLSRDNLWVGSLVQLDHVCIISASTSVGWAQVSNRRGRFRVWAEERVGEERLSVYSARS